MPTTITLPEHLEIEDVLADGELTSLLRARDHKLQHTVAVKAIKPVEWLDRADASARRQRLIETFSPLVGVKNDHVAELYEVGEHDGVVYLTREWVNGAPLQAAFEPGKSLEMPVALRIAEQCALALTAWRIAGVTHGSLSADNILLLPDGETVRLTDPQFAAAASELVVAGVTCHLGRRGGPASDITALAALLYRALTGEDALVAGAEIDPGKLLPVRSRAAIARAIRHGERAFESAAEFVEAFTPPAPKQRSSATLRLSWRPAAAVGLLGALATVGGNAYSEKGGRRLEQPRQPVVVEAVAKPQAMPLSTDQTAAALLAIRRQGAASLASPAIADLFHLTDRQREEIAAILAEQRDQVETMVSDATLVRPNSGGEEMQSLRETTCAKILIVLDDAQRAQWTEIAARPAAPGEPIL